jgi:DNA-binding protein HU-beta
MIKAELAQKVAQEVNLTPKQAQVVIEVTFKHIKNALVSGEDVVVRKFGRFAQVTQAAKIGQDISKGKAIKIPARKTPKFKPAKEFVESVRSGKNTGRKKS